MSRDALEARIHFGPTAGDPQIPYRLHATAQGGSERVISRAACLLGESLVVCETVRANQPSPRVAR